MRRDVFQAIADPNREKNYTIDCPSVAELNAVAAEFDISRPAISKHMRILTECGLVSVRQEGRERYCEANLQQLQEVSQWIEQYRVF